ncbi:MAG: heavy metal-associated domain-containing protein [Flavobacteriaceae bacterium]|jgi:Cu+-exporting ATPase|nr:heavy metal-associated domain-containing protein [Flavobacteriaceae bacterium]
MKLIKLLGLLLVFLAFSCNGEKQQKIASQEVAEQSVLAENLEEISFEIDGMTCEYGCAKMIEHKLGNTKGVDSVSVDFETNLAYISFDKTQQSKENLKKTIETLVDGNTYKASEINNNN